MSSELAALAPSITPADVMETKLYFPDDLKRRGIPFSRQHIDRLIKAGQFPKPVKVFSRNAWVAAEIDAFIEACIAARNAVR
jgi:prophage regulatory protein